MLTGAVSGMCRLVGSIGLMPLTFLIPPALWIKVRSKCCTCVLDRSSLTDRHVQLFGHPALAAPFSSGCTSQRHGAHTN